MLKLPPEYKDKEILYRRLILFSLSIGLLVVYAAQIFDFIAKAIWLCMPFIIGGILAFILNTFMRVLMRFAETVLHVENPEKQSLFFRILALVIVLLFMIMLIYFIIPQLLGSAEKLAKEFPLYYQNIYSQVYELSRKIPPLHEWMDANSEVLADAPALLGKMMTFITTGSAANALNNIANVISNTFSWMWTLILSVFFSVIAFFNTRHFVKESTFIGKAFFSETVYNRINHVIGLICRIFSQYIGGSVLECIILATLVSVFGLIFQIPYSILIGVLVGVCALVPMFGATVGAILCALFLCMESPGKALTFLIMFVCIQQIEGNFIYPNVVGKSVGLPPMYVVVAITIGAGLAGVLGMIISIPVASVIYELILEQARNRTDMRLEPDSPGAGNPEKKDVPDTFPTEVREQKAKSLPAENKRIKLSDTIRLIRNPEKKQDAKSDSKRKEKDTRVRAENINITENEDNTDKTGEKTPPGK